MIKEWTIKYLILRGWPSYNEDSDNFILFLEKNLLKKYHD